MKLSGDYPEGSLADRLAQMAFLDSLEDTDYDDGDALFNMLCVGVRMYVDAWVAFGHPGIGGIVATDDDLADPARITDPHAMTRTLLRLALDAISDNITHDLDAEIERGEAS